MSGRDRGAWICLAERTRFIAVGLLVAFAIGWLCWFYPFDDLLDRSGTPLGADFAMFYVAGEVVAAGEVDSLYDQAAHQRRLQTLFPNLDQRFCLPYRYPPLVAMVAAPLSRLPYAVAFAIFSAASVVACAASLALLAHQLPVLRGVHRHWLLWACAGWPVVLETLIGGQASLLALLVCTATIVALRLERVTLAGVLLALAICKPNVLFLFAVGAVVYRPRLLKGAIPTGLLLVLGMILGGGWPVVAEYVALSSELATSVWSVETPFWKVHSLAAWLGMLVPGPHRVICAVAGVFAAALLGWQWRRCPQHESACLALLMIVNALFNPYTPIYDLSLLLIAGLFAAQHLLYDRTRDRTEVGSERISPAPIYLALPLVYFGPHVSQAVAKSIGLQLFPLLLFTTVVAVSIVPYGARWYFSGRLRSA